MLELISKALAAPAIPNHPTAGESAEASNNVKSPLPDLLELNNGVPFLEPCLVLLACDSLLSLLLTIFHSLSFTIVIIHLAFIIERSLHWSWFLPAANHFIG